jgi:hypothetical protein
MHTVSYINVPCKLADPYYKILNVVLYYCEWEGLVVDCRGVEGLRDVVGLGLASVVTLVRSHCQVA